MLACQHQTKDIISFLIDNGCDINHTNINNDTGFTLACKNNKNVETIQYLINIGFDINHKNSKGENGLSLAYLNNENINVIKYLIENGTSIDVSTKFSSIYLNNKKQLEKFLNESNYIVFLPFKSKIMNKEQIEIFNIVNYSSFENLEINTLKEKLSMLYEFIIKYKLKGDLLKRIENKQLVEGFQYKQLLKLAIQGVKIRKNIKKIIKLIDRNRSFEALNSNNTIIINNKKYNLDKNYIAKHCSELNFIFFNDMVNKNEVIEINFANKSDEVIEIYFDSLYGKYKRIELLMPNEIIELARLVDQYPTTYLNIPKLEFYLCNTFHANFKGYYDELVTRYELYNLLGLLF